MIRLDLRTRPLGEVVDALNDRYDLGLFLRLGPEPWPGLMVFDPGEPDRLRELRTREVRPRAARPLPFWEAIDRLCEAGALRYGIPSGKGSGSVRAPWSYGRPDGPRPCLRLSVRFASRSPGLIPSSSNAFRAAGRGEAAGRRRAERTAGRPPRARSDAPSERGGCRSRRRPTSGAVR